MGLAEGEFWRLTPREFHYLMAAHGEREKRRMFGFRFLATVVSRLAGSEDADFMADAAEEHHGDASLLAAFLQSRATNGTSSTDSDQAIEGTPDGVAERGRCA